MGRFLNRRKPQVRKAQRSKPQEEEDFTTEDTEKHRGLI